MISACIYCGGRGRRIKKPCLECLGAGVTKKQRNIVIKVPPGFLIVWGVTFHEYIRGH